MARKPLRVVTPDEPPPARRFLTVASAAADGTRRDLLVAMRSRVATAVDDPNTPAREFAALTRRLMEIAKDIDALDIREREEGERAPTPDERWDAEAL